MSENVQTTPTAAPPTWRVSSEEKTRGLVRPGVPP